MRKSNTESLSKVVQLSMRSLGIERQYLEYRVIQSWEEVMGQNIAHHTTQLYFKQSTLFVQVKSAALRHELFMIREEIQKKLNEAVDAYIVKNIIIQ